MTLLLSNDDGIAASGLALLVEALRGVDDLLVVAPEENRSGIGHAVTFDEPVSVRRLSSGDGVRRVAVSGTPADCVKFALKHLLPEAPELVLTGVNAGPNVGVNLFYSGTVGAAFEALIHGVNAIAVSAGRGPDLDPAAIAAFTLETLAMAREIHQLQTRGELPREPFCLNLNIPALPLSEIRGLRVTRHGRSGFDELFHAVHDETTERYRIHGDMRLVDADDSYDATALDQGWASLTPLRMDWTHTALHRHLSGRVAVRD